jgi:hypothetical protein
MNKRIREVVRKLAEQAYVEHRQEYFCDNDDPTITSVSVTRHFDREKFAELIVRECISVVDSLASPDDSDDYFWTVQNTSSKLKEHFGVEE